VSEGHNPGTKSRTRGERQRIIVDVRPICWSSRTKDAAAIAGALGARLLAVANSPDLYSPVPFLIMVSCPAEDCEEPVR
jgi:hypothetical protein